MKQKWYNMKQLLQIQLTEPTKYRTNQLLLLLLVVIIFMTRIAQSRALSSLRDIDANSIVSASPVMGDVIGG